MHFTSSDRSIECVPSIKIITTTDRRKKRCRYIRQRERERRKNAPGTSSSTAEIFCTYSPDQRIEYRRHQLISNATMIHLCHSFHECLYNIILAFIYILYAINIDVYRQIDASSLKKGQYEHSNRASISDKNKTLVLPVHQGIDELNV